MAKAAEVLGFNLSKGNSTAGAAQTSPHEQRGGFSMCSSRSWDCSKDALQGRCFHSLVLLVPGIAKRNHLLRGAAAGGVVHQEPAPTPLPLLRCVGGGQLRPFNPKQAEEAGALGPI